MDDATKKNALEKIDMMNSHVAYPDELWNDTELDAYYQNIELTGGNFLESSLNVTLFMILKEYSSLRLPAKKDDWTLYVNAAAVNAFYSRLPNAIGNYILTENVFCFITIFGVVSIKHGTILHGVDSARSIRHGPCLCTRIIEHSIDWTRHDSAPARLCTNQLCKND